MSGPISSPSLPEAVRHTFSVMKAGAEAGRLAHGYVVSCAQAEQGIQLAELILQWIQCTEADKPCGHCRSCLHVAAHAHPDVAWLEPESKSRVIKIDQIRRLNQVLGQKSYEGGWKAAVLLHAERMNDSAANAFLKTLEEPPPRCLLLLITENPQELLATIVSRCQRVHVAEALEGKEVSKIEAAMLTWLGKRGPAATPAEQSAWINTILGEVRSRAEAEEKEKAEASGQEIDADQLKARVQARSIEARSKILNVLYRWERDLLVCALDPQSASLFYPDYRPALTDQASRVQGARIFERLQRIEKASRLLDGNVPEAAVWEAFLPV